MDCLCLRCKKSWKSYFDRPNTCRYCNSAHWQTERPPKKIRKPTGRAYSYPALAGLGVGESIVIQWVYRPGCFDDSRPKKAILRLAKKTGRKFERQPTREGLYVRRTA